jgi:UDP-N-acetylglucosamine 1-carboxyvinyltransferase
MRASFFVLGARIARTGHAKVSLPGGCAIGARPVDLHLKGLQALGATVELAEGYVLASAPDCLKGAEVVFPMVSVGATENVLMAVRARPLGGCAARAEITDLGNCPPPWGRRFRCGHRASSLRCLLHGASYAVLPDRIETDCDAIAIAGGEVRPPR